jgi:hypothetical protein
MRRRVFAPVGDEAEIEGEGERIDLGLGVAADRSELGINLFPV